MYLNAFEIDIVAIMAFFCKRLLWVNRRSVGIESLTFLTDISLCESPAPFAGYSPPLHPTVTKSDYARHAKKLS